MNYDAFIERDLAAVPAVIALIRAASDDGGFTVAQETKRSGMKSRSALRKRHPLERRRGIEIVTHGREHAIEIRFREQ